MNKYYIKKSLLLLLFSIVFTLNFNSPAYASSSDVSSTTDVTITPINDDYYYETIISDVDTPSNPISPLATSTTVTKKKTLNVKDSNGNILWSVSVTGTFRYDGNTSVCLSCYHSTSVTNTAWSIVSASSSKLGNSATATATAQLSILGVTNNVTKSVTLTCSTKGVFS